MDVLLILVIMDQVMELTDCIWRNQQVHGIQTASTRSSSSMNSSTVLESRMSRPDLTETTTWRSTGTRCSSSMPMLTGKAPTLHRKLCQNQDVVQVDKLKKLQTLTTVSVDTSSQTLECLMIGAPSCTMDSISKHSKFKYYCCTPLSVCYQMLILNWTNRWQHELNPN